MKPRLKWTDYVPEDEFIGPPCPDMCEAGVESHRWLFQWSACDGAGLSTNECPICDRGVQNGLFGDWPHEFLTIKLDVTLEAVTEVYGYESPEYGHFVYMTPSPRWIA